MNVRHALIPCLSLGFAGVASAASILAPGDIVRAFDHDVGPSSSGSPAAEGVANILDSNSGTKYLNTGGAGSGFIVTPAGGSSLIESFILTTANDAADRDPTSYQLYGTNDPILSGQHSNGLGGENWTIISNGAISLPAARLTAGSPVSFTNTLSFLSYKLIFPTLGGSNLMQIADASFWTGSGGSGANVLVPGSGILAVDQPGFSSSYPGGEPPGAGIDGNFGTKYLNFGEVNAGFIVQPAFGPSLVNSFEIWTANDAEVRDPTGIRIYGSNDPLASIDNGFGDSESWTLITDSPVALPPDRNGASSGVVTFANSSIYSLYKIEVTGVKDAAAANSFQFSEFQLYGVVPEPGTAALGLVAASGLLLRRRRN